MSILTEIKTKQTEARKARNSELAVILTTLYSEVANIGLNNGKRETTDEEAISIIKKSITNANDCLKVLPPDSTVRDRYNTEIMVLSGFLPTQLTETQLLAKMAEVPNAKELKDIMGFFKKTYAGLYDGRTLKLVAEEYLREKA